MSKRPELLAFCFAAVAAAYAPLLTLHELGVGGAFRYFAADAFYYLAVAEHSAAARFYTFDGRFPTNGFHPLWQYYLTFAFAQLRLAPSAQLLFTFGSGVAFTAIGTGLFAAAVQRVTRSVSLALLASVPGFYYLLLPVLNVRFTQWSFVNGMESSLSVLFFGSLCYLLVNRSLIAGTPGVMRATALSSVLTLLVLTRLDDIFLFVPFGAFLVARAGSPKERLVHAAAFGAVPLLCIGAYLAFNLSYAGVLMPVSGASKNEGLFWGLLRNSLAVVTTLFPFIDPLGRENTVWSSEAWRVLQMLVPAAAAAAWIAATWRSLLVSPKDPSAAQRVSLILLCLYVLLKAAYNFAFVRLWHQGQWYYPVSIMTFNWIVAAALAGVIERLRASRTLGAPDWETWRVQRAAFGLVLVVLFVLLHANAFGDAKRQDDFGVRNYHFWERRDFIARTLEHACPGCGVVEFDDGILSYSLPVPVMSGLGLTLDKGAFDAQRRGELLDVAFARGFRILASLNYPMPAGTYEDPERLRRGLALNSQLRGQKLDGWEFETLLVDFESGVSFVQFRPRTGTTGPYPTGQP